MVLRSPRLTDTSRWLLPVLMALLVLGHACELPAYAELISDHTPVTHESPSAPHDDGDGHALVCDGAIAVPAQGTPDWSPISSVAAMAAFAGVVPSPASVRPVPVGRMATGPPLFLQFSSLLL